MSRENLEWAVFNNFSHGIAQVPGTNHPLGTAVDDETYGCLSNTAGALVPGPALTREITYTPPSIPPDQMRTKFWITGLGVFGPITKANIGNTGGEEQSNAELWFGFQWFFNSSGKLKETKRISRYLRAYQSPVWEDITENTMDGIPDPGGILTPRPCVFAFTTANPDDPTTIGIPIIAFVFNEIVGYFPDHETPDVSSVRDIPKPPLPFPQPWRVVAHQGRLAIFPLNVYHHGGQGALIPNGEGFYWTKINNPTELAPEWSTDPEEWMGFYDGRFQSESPTGWRSVASLSANELLLFKGKGGAVVIRGDLDDPVVINLPNVTDTGFSRLHGTPSPIGYVYAADAAGVWVWSGSDSSQHISRQLDDMFWRPVSDEPYFSTESNMKNWREWVIAPNGWLLDTDGMGWWRYHDPDLPVLARHDTDWTSRWLYASPLDFSHENPVVAYEFDRRTPRRSFSWKSHPFAGGMQRQAQAREVILSSSGFGEVRVSVISRDGQMSTRTFRVENEFPDAIRKDISIAGSHLQLKIESVGDPGHPAPTVYEVRVGIQERMRLGRA